MSNMETIYDKRIAPLMEEIIAICREYHIPVVASYQLNSEEDPLLCTTALRLDEADPRLRSALNVLYHNHVAFPRGQAALMVTALEAVKNNKDEEAI